MTESARQYRALTLYRRLVLQARPYWLHIVGFLLLSLLATPLALLAPLPLKIAVDSLIGGEPYPAMLQRILPDAWTHPPAGVLVVAVLLVLFAALAQLQLGAVSLLKTYVGEKLVLSFRERLFRHVQRLSLAYHDTAGSSDSVYRIQYDAPAIQALVIDSLVPLLSAVFMLASMLYVTALVSMRLAMVALVVTPLLAIVTLFFSGRLRQQWREVKSLESSAQSVVQEVLGAVRVVKAFSREDAEQERFTSHSHRSVGARVRAALHEHYFGLFVGMIMAGGTAAVLYIGVNDVRRGALKLGNLLLVMAYLKQLYEPLKAIGKQLASKQRSLAGAERAFELLDQLPEVVERPGARHLARARGHLRFQNLSFRYSDGPMVLRNVNLDIPVGSRVGVVGRTGAGKTTLMNLLTRFYDPVEGQILLDGVDLRDYKLADLREQFSIVLQEPVLFSTTIAENIAYGRLGSNLDDVIAAARAADAHEFVSALPDGYDTLVGERGMRLSGGERQRISLARAFLRNAPILILDEPTSSVDTQTEATIIEAMQRLMSARTTFVIAHRVNTLESCDMILAVEGGQVSKVGGAVAIERAPDGDARAVLA